MMTGLNTMTAAAQPTDNNLVTSYFANWRALQKSGYTVVSIARHPPLSFKGPRLEVLAPPSELLTNYKLAVIGKEEFESYYIKYLEQLTTMGTLQATLSKYLNGKYALCCYEKPGDFCHRHILAAYLKKKFSYIITEFTK